MTVLATRELELSLLNGRRFVAGMDEVGRGALAGPVSVGVALVDTDCGEPPVGLTDSKLLTPAKRVALCEPIRQWVRASGVGHAFPGEIDAFGIVGGLRLAGQRALLQAIGGEHVALPDVIILDGIHDWLTEPHADLISLASEMPADQQWRAKGYATPPVRTQVKADMTCAVVAAASVLAKVERDALMVAQEDPGYGWASNKGYAAAAHVDGLRRLGASTFHRRSWKLPGIEPR
ncbi:ribonuclease HII [Schaalia canis]|uniref:Ribonuclease n=1 Tax=Schaalia canis TaxID=100469 RepID=A0A3P1SDP9_9ACTO|nr:ribonuclease HII [Schaalia canis]RRC95154.1 ribonuclease HII [Schaalia canis]